MMDKTVVWPEYVRIRIRNTYCYLASSLAITAGAAICAFRSPTVMRILAGAGNKPLMALIASYAAVIGTGMAVHALPYEHPLKHFCWFIHAGTLGVLISPLMILGGPLLARAAWCTAGITGSLSLVAACAPSHQFLNWSGPLSIGLGTVVIASIGSMFAGPPVGLLSAGLYSITTYGGLVLFSGMLLYDTQKIANKAESAPPKYPFDPINESTSIFLDILNIFTRMVMILSGSNGNKQQKGRVNRGIGGRR